MALGAATGCRQQLCVRALRVRAHLSRNAARRVIDGQRASPHNATRCRVRGGRGGPRAPSVTPTLSVPGRGTLTPVAADGPCVYAARIVKIAPSEEAPGEFEYRVHYLNWNKSYALALLGALHLLTAV